MSNGMNVGKSNFGSFFKNWGGTATADPAPAIPPTPAPPPASQAAPETVPVALPAAVAAPVRRFDGRIVAALNVSGPSFRFGPRLGEAGPVVAAAAVRLSARLQDEATPVAVPAT